MALATPSTGRPTAGDSLSVAAAVRSSASTPSLRSRDGTAPAKMDRGGNVRVVVRVRAFLQRGEHAPIPEADTTRADVAPRLSQNLNARHDASSTWTP